MRHLFVLTIGFVFLMSTGMAKADYVQDCNNFFPPSTYPGLNDFCLYLVGTGELIDESKGLRGYANLYIKDDNGIFRDYGVQGYPSINFPQMMNNHANDLINAYTSPVTKDMDDAIRKLIGDVHDIHMKYFTVFRQDEGIPC